jgi:IMP dehydrogenase
MFFYVQVSLALLLATVTHVTDAQPTITQGLSYNDVLLIPNHSSAKSRSDAQTNTKLSRRISLSTPIVSANMDTVTESQMAIAMAQCGGIGIIHRFNSIEDQVSEIEKVKRFRSAVIAFPITISPEATVYQARQLMKEKNVTGLLVADSDNKLLGIFTSRDMRFLPEKETSITELMTHRKDIITGTKNTSVAHAKQLLMKHRIEKLPLIDENDCITGLITSKDIYHRAEYPHASTDSQDRLLVGAAIGVKEDSVDRAKALIAAGADVLVIDIAHGDSDLEVTTLKQIKSLFPEVDVIAGNVCTAQGAQRLIDAGADALKVGVGPGSICTTRIVSGSGYPQLSAVINCALVADKYNIPVIADGGIQTSGDITKAIAAGASTVMLGSLLAGTDESPGIPFLKNGKKFKVIRGMASFGTNLKRADTTKKESYVPEGVEAIILYKGSVLETIHQLIGGLYSGMSYCGVSKLQELRSNGNFVQITAAGIRESRAHDVQEMA